jgi:hypothetical protein
VFGLGGLSSEKFTAERDTSLWLYDEDRIDTDFRSRMAGLGAAYTKNLGPKAGINAGISYSRIKSERRGTYIFDNYIRQSLQYDALDNDILSLTSELNLRSGTRNTYRFGIMIDTHTFDNERMVIHPDMTPTHMLRIGRGAFLLTQPYFAWERPLSEKLNMEVGLHYVHQSSMNDQSIEPRVALRYALNNTNSIKMHYGLVSQTQIPQVYLYSPGGGERPNDNLGLTKSHQFTIGYTSHLSGSTVFSAEGYYQSHFDVPVAADEQYPYSVVNATDGFILHELVNEGSARNMGVDLSLRRTMERNFYYFLTASVFDAQYKALDDVRRNTRFNSNFNTSITAGKEFIGENKEKNRVMGVNLRVLYHAGFRTAPVDVSTRQTELPENSGAGWFDERLPAYFRADFSIYFKRHRPNYTRTILIDVQNLTNRQNIAYTYYDLQQDRQVEKTQLGIIPSISYRVES